MQNPINEPCSQGVAPVSSSMVLKVWDIVNRHFESLLATSNRTVTKNRAEINIQSQVKELHDLMAACCKRLESVEAYVSDLQKKNMGTVNEVPGAQKYSELEGEWHFLYMGNDNIFGYMKIIPDTVCITREGSVPVKRAEFTLPFGVLGESNQVSVVAEEHTKHTNSHVSCPFCRRSFADSEFWKHALFEIADRGKRVPAWQSLDRTERPRWIVEESAGWTSPIYRPCFLRGTCDIGQSLAELNLQKFLSDHEFSQALDDTFECLALQLRN